MQGIILGLAISASILAFGFLFGDIFVAETKNQQRLLFAILVTSCLLAGGVAGWAFSTLL